MLYEVITSFAVWLLGFGGAKFRGRPLTEAAMEAHTAMIGNTGFLGVPMLVVLLGPKAAGPVLMVLTTDLIVFSSLITMIITAARHGHVAIKPLAIRNNFV